MSMDKMLCTLGVFDIPLVQMQPPFVVDLLDANIAVFGASMSGKSTFIKTLVNILHKKYNEKREQVFILDFGGALSEYQKMPLVAAYFDNSNEEYVKRVFKILEKILKDNIKALDGKNFRDAEDQPIHTTFIIDNINAFLDESRYSAYHDKFAKLCRDGLSKGISIVVTAVETKGMGSLLGSFKQKVAFEMPPDKYNEIFNGKVGQLDTNPGHGFANVTVKPDGVTGAFRMNLPYEVQCKLPYGKAAGENVETEESFHAKVQTKFRFADGKFARCVKQYQTFPKELLPGDFETLRQQPPAGDKEPEIPVSVGLDYVDFYPVTVDMKESHVMAIYGKRGFGKTNLLWLLLKGLLKQKENARLVFVDDGRGQLADIHKKYEKTHDCKYFNGTEEASLMLEAAKGGIAAEARTRKLSPLQRFYVYLHENYTEISPDCLQSIFSLDTKDKARISTGKEYTNVPEFTVFVIQSKLVYLNTQECKHFIEKVLPRMVSVAEENGYLFIFSDVQKISEPETNTIFNNSLHTVFLLDNIAEFAGERGQKTVFGNMDVKNLKEDYAKCELGDGYCYDIEADRLLKVKYIKDGEV